MITMAQNAVLKDETSTTPLTREISYLSSSELYGNKFFFSAMRLLIVLKFSPVLRYQKILPVSLRFPLLWFGSIFSQWLTRSRYARACMQRWLSTCF